METYLFKTDIKTGGFEAKALSSNKQDDFILLKYSGTKEKLKASKIKEKGGKLFLEFPELREKPAFNPPEEILPYLEWILMIQKAKAEYPQTYPQWVEDRFYATDEGLLLPPKSIMHLILNREKLRNSAVDPYNHPDLREEGALSFTIGVLLYNKLTQRMPFQGASTVDIHFQIREQQFSPIEYFCPELNPQLSQMINRSIRGEVTSLQEWEELLKILHTAPLYRALTREEKEDLLKKGKHLYKRTKRKFNRQVFFRKYQMRLITLGLIGGVLCFILGITLKNILKPRETAGFSQERVIESFYHAIDDLRPDLLRDCIESGVAREIVSMVETLYVTTRMQIAKGGGLAIVKAQEWIDAERSPDFVQNKAVYGIANLVIERLGPNEFIATYEFWIPADTEITESLPYIGNKKTDRLLLTKDDQGWLIKKLEEKSEIMDIP